MSRARLTVFVVVALGATIGLTAPDAQASFPPGTTTAKSAADPNPNSTTQIWRLRTSNMGSFDRVIFDERYSLSDYSVRYVNQVYADPSGNLVPVVGSFFLQVVVHDATTQPHTGALTYIPVIRNVNLPQVRQIRKTGEFEQVVSFAIGLHHHRGFRVLRLSSPRRLVIDVLH